MALGAPDHDPAEGTQPSAFYTGLVAELYGVLRSADPDPAPYERFVRRWGEPALELACGDGDPLLDLVAAGLDVHGLDSSADMLERCRRRAGQRGLQVTLHHQPMEAMQFPVAYRSMYVAGPSFNLLPDDASASAALRRIAENLVPGGAALVPLFVPDPVSLGDPPTSRRLDDGTVLSCGPVSTSRDDQARRQVVLLRYERAAPSGAVEVLEREWLLHWHRPEAFAAMAGAAGLEVVGQRALDGTPTDGTGMWTALLRRPANSELGREVRRDP